MLICWRAPAPTYGADRQMKALFLGNVAADTANGIAAELPSSLRVEIVADPGQLVRTPEADVTGLPGHITRHSSIEHNLRVPLKRSTASAPP